MSKYLMVMALPFLVAGCIGGRPQAGPGKVPKDIDSAGYSSLAAVDVANCITNSTRQAATREGSGYRIALSGASYTIEPTSTAGSYTTQVLVRGQASDTEQVYAVARCMAGGGS
jgi:hypothetical protein